VNREEVYGADAALGLALEEFIAVAIEGIQQVAPEIGLQGHAHEPGGR
jgi:predicted hydrolase (HD superfamily)